MPKSRHKVLDAEFLQGIINIAVPINIGTFLLFVSVSKLSGGTTARGYTKDGKFFLEDHGSYTEAGAAVWNLSYYLEVTFLVLLALLALVTFWKFVVGYLARHHAI